MDIKYNAFIFTKLNRLSISSTRTTLLGIFAGIYISLGALIMAIAKADGCNRLICGLVFSFGLFAVVVTGSELFTGNCLILGLTATDTKFSKNDIQFLLINSYFSNLIGTILMFFLTIFSGINTDSLVSIAISKCSISPIELIFRGFLCNFLVCLAICFANFISPSDTKESKFISIVFPVVIFVACGFEHSIANMYILPFGVLANEISILQYIAQIFYVTIGNWLGGIFLGILFKKAY